MTKWIKEILGLVLIILVLVCLYTKVCVKERGELRWHKGVSDRLIPNCVIIQAQCSLMLKHTHNTICLNHNWVHTNTHSGDLVKSSNSFSYQVVADMPTAHMHHYTTKPHYQFRLGMCADECSFVFWYARAWIESIKDLCAFNYQACMGLHFRTPLYRNC